MAMNQTSDAGGKWFQGLLWACHPPSVSRQTRAIRTVSGGESPPRGPYPEPEGDFEAFVKL